MKSILFSILLCITSIVYAQSDSVGIYAKNGDRIEHILPLRFSQQKTNTLGSALSYGIASSKIKAVYNGSNANVVISDENCSFLFYFPEALPLSMSQSYFMFSRNYTPGDFVICKLKEKKNKRELDTGKVNIYAGSSIGVNPDDKLKVKINKRQDGVYELTFNEFPDEGEYCFIFTGVAGAGSYMPIFDFSIKNKKEGKHKEETNTWY